MDPKLGYLYNVTEEFPRSGNIYCSIGQPVTVKHRCGKAVADTNIANSIKIPIRIGKCNTVSLYGKRNYAKDAMLRSVSGMTRTPVRFLDKNTNEKFSYDYYYVSREWNSLDLQFCCLFSYHNLFRPYPETMYETALAWIITEWAKDSNYMVVGQYSRRRFEDAEALVKNHLKSKGVTDIKSFVNWTINVLGESVDMFSPSI